ncbi:MULTISPECIES: hypothetical protein [unclassified Mesorhizobium]|uniref:hypothetical protein n=1 Tax=unclassified Mesorhizobium TaxID=325217 RepID=UPI00163D656A|nr:MULTISPECIES: hypothetical protein [unclassified Mesorhizobium]
MKTANASPLNYGFLASDQVQTGSLPPELIASLEALPVNHAACFYLSEPHRSYRSTSS